MPKASSKRVAQETKAPPAKKPRVSPSLKAIEDSLSQATFLPEPCKRMLLAMLPSLDVPADKRCEVAKAAVRMFGEMLEGLTTQLEQSAQAAQARVDVLDASKGELEEAVTRAEAALADAGSVVEARVAEASQAKERLVGAEAAAAAKQEAQRASAAVLALMKEAQATLVQGIDVHLGAIAEGRDGAEHFQALQPTLRRIGIDDSLLAALPSICARPTSERAPFDNVAIEELQRKMQTKADQLSQEIEQHASESEAHAAAAEAARGELAAAEGARCGADEALAAARAGQQAAEAALEGARAAVDSLKPQCQQAMAGRDAQALELQTHKEYSLILFESLRDRMSAQQTPDAARKDAAVASDEAMEPAEGGPAEPEAPVLQEPKVPEAPTQVAAGLLCAGAGGA